jgi:uncharacterized protein YjbJ (UPF0337 family)
MKIRASGLAASLAALAILICTMLGPLPAMAMAGNHALSPIAFGTMPSKVDAAAKDAEGKLESAYGELTGDTGHQIKGKAKQVQASAMNTAADLEQGAKSVAKKLSDAAGKLVDNQS